MMHTLSTEPYSPDLLELIQSALVDCDAGQHTSELQSLEVEGLQTQPYSTVAFLVAQWDTQTQRLVAKTIAHHPHNQRLLEQQNQALVEYKAMERLHASFQKIEGCSVPRPLLVLPEVDTYIMEFVEGDLLDTHFKYVRYFSSPSGFRRLLHSYSLCGRWLKHLLHVSGTRYAGPEVLEEIAGRCDDLLERIREESGDACPANLKKHVKGNLDRYLSKLNHVKILTSDSHGDFGPWNILAKAEEITVFDFFGFEERPVPIDLLSVLVHLETEQLGLTSSRNRVDAVKRSFLSGYGELASFPEPLLLICETLPRLTSLLHAYRFRNSGKLHHRIQRRRLIRRHLRWLTDERKQRLLLSSM